MFKYIGNHERELAMTILMIRFQNILAKHGSGKPRNHLNPTMNCLKPKSEAIIQFDGISQPLDMIL